MSQTPTPTSPFIKDMLMALLLLGVSVIVLVLLMPESLWQAGVAVVVLFFSLFVVERFLRHESRPRGQFFWAFWVLLFVVLVGMSAVVWAQLTTPIIIQAPAHLPSETPPSLKSYIDQQISALNTYIAHTSIFVAFISIFSTLITLGLTLNLSIKERRLESELVLKEERLEAQLTETKATIAQLQKLMPPHGHDEGWLDNVDNFL